jgi:hypothetical protein
LHLVSVLFFTCFAGLAAGSVVLGLSLAGLVSTLLGWWNARHTHSRCRTHAAGTLGRRRK